MDFDTFFQSTDEKSTLYKYNTKSMEYFLYKLATFMSNCDRTLPKNENTDEIDTTVCLLWVDSLKKKKKNNS